MKKFKYVIICLPIAAFILILIPRVFSLQLDPGEPPPPFYSKYLIGPWIVAAIFFYPTTWLASQGGQPPFSIVHKVLMLIWAGGISMILYRMLIREKM